MANKKPIRTVFNDSNVATGLAEFQSGETVGLEHGGLGAALSIGSAGQVLKVNSGATALEFGAVEAIVNIDGATDLTGNTLAATDKLLISDGGTEGRANLSQIQAAIKDTTATLTNKTISGGSNTLTNIANSSLTNSTINFGGVSLALGASDTTPAFDLSDATAYPTSSLTGTITNAQLAGSIAASKLAGSIGNAKLSNSAVTIGSTAISLGSSATTIAGISNLTAGGINITGNSITSADSTVIEMGEGLSVTGNLTVSGNMTVSGTTTSLETSNTAVTDNLFELNRGNSNNTDDSGIIIERGSAGDNAIMFWDESNDEFVFGTTSATADSNGNISHTKADFQAATIRGTSGNFISTGITAVMTVTGTDDGAGEGPDIVIKRNSASPADDDILGALVFKGENDADQAVTYGKVRARALDVTDGTEDGQLEFSTIKAGSITSLATMDSTGLYLNQSLGIFFEGDGADAHELKLVAADSLSGDVTVTLPAATDTLVGKATTDTLTNKTINGSNNTLTNIATSSLSGTITNAQLAGSIVNAKLSNSTITIRDDASTSDAVALGETLIFEGGSGVTTTVTDNKVSIATDGSIVTETSTDTLTNKTLTSPVLNTGVSGTAIKDEDNMASDSNTHLATQQSIKAYVDSQILTKDNTDEITEGSTNLYFTNARADARITNAIKDEDNMASNSDTHIPSQQSVKAYVDATVTAQDLDFQGDSGGALNIDLDSEVLDIAGGTGIDTSGSGNTLTVAIDSTVTTLAGTQTLTNKTLTSPKINEDVAVTATATQLNHTVGVTSAIQTQLDAKTTAAFAIAQAVALG